MSYRCGSELGRSRTAQFGHLRSFGEHPEIHRNQTLENDAREVATAANPDARKPLRFKQEVNRPAFVRHVA